MDQTCFGRSGGFAPTIFPLFHGTCLDSLVLGTSAMMTSSVNEAGHSLAGNLLNSVGFRRIAGVLSPIRSIGRAQMTHNRRSRELVAILGKALHKVGPKWNILDLTWPGPAMPTVEFSFEIIVQVGTVVDRISVED
jgi:hypothetical protein